MWDFSVVIRMHISFSSKVLEDVQDIHASSEQFNWHSTCARKSYHILSEVP